MTVVDTAAADKARELRLRIASAVVLAPIVIGVTAWGGVPFAGLVVLCAVLMSSEWATIVLGRSWGSLRIATLAASGLATAAMAAGLRGGVPMILAIGLAVVVLGLAIAATLIEAKASVRDDVRTWAPFGPLYAVLPSVSIDALRVAENGPWLVVFLFAVVWSTDIAAFFAGRAIGGPKLWPAVSPKKTWSGAIGGFLGAAVAGIVVASFAGAPHLVPVFFVAAALSIVSQAGDLFESSLKRRFGVKDSGWIIPGHGGILDRVDGLVTAAVLAVAIALLNGGLGGPIGGLLAW